MADYFSRLPEPLIHHILSFRPFKEIGLTCVLSKYFNSVWNKYPNLEFVLNLVDREFNNQERVEKCLDRRPFIQQLSLEIISSPTAFIINNDLKTKLDLWLGLSVDRLVLKQDCLVYYSVPHQVLVASRLQLLDLSFCIFNEDSFVRIELPCLEKLCLLKCFVGDNLLQKILCACPKMKHISLEYCKGLGNSLSVSCTPLLKHFLLRRDASSIPVLEKITIDAPSLHTFSYESRGSCHAACDIDLTTCTNLKELYLYYFVDTVFEQLRSIFPGIQVLEMSNCCLKNKYKISCPSLKRLFLHDAHGLKDIGIDAPNLQSFEHNFSSMFKFSSWSIPKADDIHIKFSAWSFPKAYSEGLEDVLMKLPNYEDLKLLFLTNHMLVT